ncbi:MAG: glycosyltransferase [bacterium]|nr:glycosyltransferase [bacterium]
MFNLLSRYVVAYRNKLTNKFFGIVSVAHTGEKKKGVVLLSFLTGPFTKAPGEFYTDPHSNYWVSTELATLFTKRGYDVDIINWDDTQFIPKKDYVVCIDMQYNLERLSEYLPKNCIKVMHLIASYPEFQNNEEQKRIDAVEKRRGVTLPPVRTSPLTSNPGVADFLEGYGNKTVHGTYARFGKEIIPIPVPIMETYSFPEHKNFETARKNFLWFGGGGAILKGLDLVIEAFAGLPHLHLTIMGPASYEKEFEEIYAHELSLPNIMRYGRPRFNRESGESMVGDKYVREVMDQCAAVIGLSASEGGGGAVVQAMQAGLFPIVTPQTGINELAPSIVVQDLDINNIRRIIEDFSNLPSEKIASLARDSWTFAKNSHTKEVFSKVYENFIDTKLKI